MENLDVLLNSQCETQSSYGSVQDDQTNEFDWFNFTAWDDEDDCTQIQGTQLNLHEQEVDDITSESQLIEPLDRQNEQSFDVEIERRENERTRARTIAVSSSIKRRRGPNKNQKILTEEERRKKKEKALCRNAESARTCRGKRKQAEERLKSKFSSLEREFQELLQTREELRREVCDLCEQARNKMDPTLDEAVNLAAARLSYMYWMTKERYVQGSLQDTGLSQINMDQLPHLTQSQPSA
ncbi:hypothetical protein K3495_g3236 [Podosphaera aphanis]|nr:hypothetical protein K3495_g3236 [Podosphaera aphanis]